VRPDFDWIVPGLAVGAGYEAWQVPWLAEEGLRAVIDVRAECCADRLALEQAGMQLLHLPTEDHMAIAPGMIEEGLAFARHAETRNWPLLIHCQHGIGRSALLALCVLTDRGGEPGECLALLKQRRAKVSPSPAQYEGWVAWLRDCKTRRAAVWVPPSFADFARTAYARPRA
jgi:hypothetical protein